MQHIDPNDETNQRQTDKLLEKSRELKERTKATNEILRSLQEDANKMKSGSAGSEKPAIDKP
jgi:hypothetical protein